MLVVGPKGTKAGLRCLTSKLAIVEIGLTLGSEQVELPSEIVAVVGGAADALIEDSRGRHARTGSRRRVSGSSPVTVGRVLHGCLQRLPVTGRLLNLTSGARNDEDPERDTPTVGPAQQLAAHLGLALFPDVDPEHARRATDVLVELASMARRGEGPPLLAAGACVLSRATGPVGLLRSSL